MRRMILVGGGHAHLGVLQSLLKRRHDTAVTLITPTTHQTYSGMLPGWMAGHYQLSDIQIDLRPLARAAGAELIIDHVVGMSADQEHVLLSDGRSIGYDLLSLDVGGETDLSQLATLGDKLLPIKPLATFLPRWSKLLEAAALQENYSVVVVGGGAAGVELALAARYSLRKISRTTSVALIASEQGVLPGHTAAAADRIEALLQSRGIAMHRTRAVGVKDGVLLGTGKYLHADIVIAATGSVPPKWLRESQLELDERGYICVDATHRSPSHDNVYAAGDVCMRMDRPLARSGVHAVFAGPVVAHNLIANLTGGRLMQYSPRRKSLYLLATGPRHAVASWGNFVAAGHWMWRWKNWIDRRFMKRHQSAGLQHA